MMNEAMDQSEEKQYLRIVILVGKLMLSNGAEAYRAEETMGYILSKKYGTDYGVSVTPTGVFASIIPNEMEPITWVDNIQDRSTNLFVIDEINRLSRKFVYEKLSLQELEQKINDLQKQENRVIYSNKIVVLASMLCAFFMTFVFGGVWTDALFAAGIGMLFGIFSCWKRVALQKVFVRNIIYGFVQSFLVNGLNFTGWLQDKDTILIACLMVLTPGIYFTNATRDIIAGDYLSGAGRVLEACVIAIAIALGVAFGLYCVGWLGGILRW